MFTPAGKKKAPSRNQVLRWVKDAWQEIPAEMVERSFTSCGISNAMGLKTMLFIQKKCQLAEEDEMEDEFATDSEEEDDD